MIFPFFVTKTTLKEPTHQRCRNIKGADTSKAPTDQRHAPPLTSRSQKYRLDLKVLNFSKYNQGLKLSFSCLVFAFY